MSRPHQHKVTPKSKHHPRWTLPTMAAGVDKETSRATQDLLRGGMLSTRWNVRLHHSLRVLPPAERQFIQAATAELLRDLRENPPPVN